MKKLFVFRAPNCKAAEEWLNIQAKEGWRLQRITALSIAHFTRAESPCQYAVRLGPIPSWANKDNLDEFMAFFEPFGWKQITALRDMHIFEAASGSDPMESDIEAEAMEYAHYHKHVRNNTIGLSVGLTLILMVGMLLTSAITFFARPFFLMTLVSLAVLAILCVREAAKYNRYKVRSKQAIEEGAPLPALSLDAAARVGMVNFVGYILFYVIWLSVALWDLSLSSRHSNIVAPAFATFIGTFVGNLAYRNWGFKKGSALKGISIIVAAIATIALLVSHFSFTDNYSTTRQDELPVLHMPGAVDEYNYYYHTATPLVQLHEYTESSADNTYYGSLCVDSVANALAELAYYDVAYNYRYFSGRKEDYVPCDFPGADKAMLNEKNGRLVIKQNKRVVCIKWGYGFNMLGRQEYFDMAREVFFEE